LNPHYLPTDHTLPIFSTFYPTATPPSLSNMERVNLLSSSYFSFHTIPKSDLSRAYCIAICTGMSTPQLSTHAIVWLIMRQALAARIAFQGWPFGGIRHPRTNKCERWRDSVTPQLASGGILSCVSTNNRGRMKKMGITGVLSIDALERPPRHTTRQAHSIALGKSGSDHPTLMPRK